jgi:hypothetical protein
MSPMNKIFTPQTVAVPPVKDTPESSDQRNRQSEELMTDDERLTGSPHPALPEFPVEQKPNDYRIREVHKNSQGANLSAVQSNWAANRTQSFILSDRFIIINAHN